MTESALSIVQHLTDARELAQRLFGKQYLAEIEPYRETIRRWRAESCQKCAPIAEACKALIELVDKKGTLGDMLRAQAACYEEMAAPERETRPKEPTT